jgi:uronate dehydrogenase
MQRVLITGAAGAIGSTLREGLRGRFPTLRLLDFAPLGDQQPGEELVTADVRDLAGITEAMDGVDATIHLAGIPYEDSFERIRDFNMTGTYHVMEAARRQGCARVVFASSNHVTGFYPVGQRIGPDAAPRPDTFYGLSKVFGEDLGRLYVDRHGLQVVCLRIGTFAQQPTEPRHLSTWLSPRDAVELFHRCVVAPDVGFLIVYGISANQRRWWDIDSARQLGYHPQDDAEHWASQIAASAESPGPAYDFQGGDFAQREAGPTSIPPDRRPHYQA